MRTRTRAAAVAFRFGVLLVATTLLVIGLAAITSGSPGTATAGKTITTEPDPIGLWHFNESTGITATDSSGNGNDATVYSGTWVTTGTVGNALRFNGVDAYAEAPDNDSLSTMWLTVDAWIFPEAYNPNDFGAGIALRWGPGGSEDDSWQIRLSQEGYLAGALSGPYTTTSQEFNSASTIPTNTWTNIRVVFDGSTVKVYLNGTLDHQFSSIITGLKDSNTTLLIGKREVGGYFKGVIDELKIWSTGEPLPTPTPTPTPTNTPTPTDTPTPTPTNTPTPTPTDTPTPTPTNTPTPGPAPYLKAETSLITGTLVSGGDVYPVITVTLDRIYWSHNGQTQTLTNGLGAYEASLTSASGCITGVSVTGSAPLIDPTVNLTSDSVVYNAYHAEATGPQTGTIAVIKLRLTGAATQTCTITNTFSLLSSVDGLTVQQETPDTTTAQRGDVQANGSVNVIDAMFIAQYLAGQRTLSTINPMNTASVRQDGVGGDHISIYDAMYIAQYRAGMRNAWFQ